MFQSVFRTLSRKPHHIEISFRFLGAMEGGGDDTIVSKLESVRKRIRNAESQRPQDGKVQSPRLVAVSKTKPIDQIIKCYEAGQRYFGENYVQELEEKANDPRILSSCPEIHWHFIGSLQTKKVSKMMSSIPRLAAIETVTSLKLAEDINTKWKKFHPEKEGVQPRLGVMVQVNTSGEEQKSGVSKIEAAELASFILDNCRSLHFMGFMTIGALSHSKSESKEMQNPDFLSLAETRASFCSSREVSLDSVELSMGMSADFEEAILMGSTNVRVGSTIFGEREKKQQ